MKYAMLVIGISNMVAYGAFNILYKFLDLFSFFDSTKEHIWIAVVILAVLTLREDVKTITEFKSLKLEQ